MKLKSFSTRLRFDLMVYLMEKGNGYALECLETNKNEQVLTNLRGSRVPISWATVFDHFDRGMGVIELHDLAVEQIKLESFIRRCEEALRENSDPSKLKAMN